MEDSYFDYLTALAVSSVILGAIIILLHSKHRIVATVVVLLGILCGQIWLFQGAIIMLGWTISGFAP